jgi:hypothetical protein
VADVEGKMVLMKKGWVFVMNEGSIPERRKIMPGFDRSGPMGAGPATGGGRGFCVNASAGYETRFFGNYGSGGGMGYGRGFRGGHGPGMRPGVAGRFGWSNQPQTVPSYTQDQAAEIEMLKAQAGSVQMTLDTISKRISDLEKGAATPSTPGKTDD